MTICKNCGTVYDEFYGVCPKCGTIYVPETEESVPAKTAGTEAVPSAIFNEPIKTPSPEIPVVRADPDPAPEAAVPMNTKPFDPDAAVPMNTKPFDPDATVPMNTKPFDPDATVPMNTGPFDPDATVPMSRPVQVQNPYAPPKDNNFGQTQDVVIPPYAAAQGNAGQYGDSYSSSETVVSVNGGKPKKKKGSAGKIIAIIVIICVVLAGLAVGAYFIWFRPQPQTQAEEQISEGDKLLSEKKYDEAADAFRKAIEADPNNASLYIKLADAYIGSGKQEDAIKTLEDGYAKTGDSKIKEKIDALKGTEQPSAVEQSSYVEQSSDIIDADAMRSNAKSLYMSVLNVYAGVTSGSISAESPGGIDPTRLPKASASRSEKEAAADALTVQDVVTYSGSTDKINASTVGYYVYEGAEIFYKDDKPSGTPLTLYTTIGEIRGVTGQSSTVESSVPDYSDKTANAAALTASVKDLYATVCSGVLHSSSPASQLNGINASRLPAQNAAVSVKKTAAEKLLVSDAVLYGGLSDKITAADIGDYVYIPSDNYGDITIIYKEDGTGTPLTMDTTFKELMTPAETSTVSEPSKPESSTPTDHSDKTVIAENLSDSVKELYAIVASGTLHKSSPASQLNGIDASKLPAQSSSMSAKRDAAEKLLVSDAIIYGGLSDKITAADIGDYIYIPSDNYGNITILYKEDGTGIPLTMDTTLKDLVSAEESSTVSEPSKPESSDTSEPQNPIPPETAAEFAGKWTTVFDTETYSEDEISLYKTQLGWDEFDLLVNADGTVSAYSVKSGKTDIIGSGTWSYDEESYEFTVVIDGDAVSFDYDDGALFLPSNWLEVLWLEKVS